MRPKVFSRQYSRGSFGVAHDDANFGLHLKNVFVINIFNNFDN